MVAVARRRMHSAVDNAVLGENLNIGKYAIGKNVNEDKEKERH